jgi:hypothetical protein
VYANHMSDVACYIVHDLVRQCASVFAHAPAERASMSHMLRSLLARQYRRESRVGVDDDQERVIVSAIDESSASGGVVSASLRAIAQTRVDRASNADDIDDVDLIAAIDDAASMLGAVERAVADTYALLGDASSAATSAVHDVLSAALERVLAPLLDAASTTASATVLSHAQRFVFALRQSESSARVNVLPTVIACCDALHTAARTDVELTLLETVGISADVDKRDVPLRVERLRSRVLLGSGAFGGVVCV